MIKALEKYNNNIAFNIIPLLIIPFIFLISKDEIVLAMIVIVLSIITILVNYSKGEWKVFILGIVIGLIIEIGGDIVFKLQSWENGSLFGIPIWLPLLFGYGFVHIRRIGNSLVET